MNQAGRPQCSGMESEGATKQSIMLKLKPVFASVIPSQRFELLIPVAVDVPISLDHKHPTLPDTREAPLQLPLTPQC